MRESVAILVVGGQPCSHLQESTRVCPWMVCTLACFVQSLYVLQQPLWPELSALHNSNCDDTSNSVMPASMVQQARRALVKVLLALAAAAPRVDGPCQDHSTCILTQRGYTRFCITLLQPLRAWTALARTTAPGF